MANLELLKASVVGPVIEALRSRGTDVTPHLAKARLPLIMAERLLAMLLAGALRSTLGGRMTTWPAAFAGSNFS